MGEYHWPPQYDPDDPVWLKVVGLIAHLPGAYTEPTWGSLTLRVNRKLFAWCKGGLNDAIYTIVFKPNPDELPFLKADQRFRPAPHFTQWLALDLGENWDPAEVQELLTDSYLLVAPNRLSQLVHQPGLPCDVIWAILADSVITQAVQQ